MNFRESEIGRVKNRVTKVIAKLFIFVLLCGFAYIILYPFIFKILSSFMSQDDLYNALVNLVPMHWTLETYKYIVGSTDFLSSLVGTFISSLICALLTVFSVSLIGYGLAKYRFAGSRLLLAGVIVTMLIPIYTLRIPVYISFRFFDLYGIISAVTGKELNLLDTVWPNVLMAATGLSFRAGIFIILIRQFYLGIPNELTEAAYVDGAGPYRTFFNIILPISRSMMVVIFSLSFAWQWTDTYYTGLLTPNLSRLSNLVAGLRALNGQEGNYYELVIRSNTAALLAVLPLILFYCILQRNIIQGIERSGLVG